MKLRADLAMKIISVEGIFWSLKEHWSILVPFVLRSASYHPGRGMEWGGFTESLFCGEGSSINVHWRSEDNP